MRTKQQNADYQREYYRRNKARLCARTKMRRARNAEPYRERLRAWRAANPDKARYYYAKYKRARGREIRQKIRLKAAAVRAEMMAAYGGRCECCGEQNPGFLTIEHKRRDGSAHRRRLGGPDKILADLKRRGWPKDDYALMCMNCNWGRRRTGICPHERGWSFRLVGGCKR